jgi:hypothetical protein
MRRVPGLGNHDVYYEYGSPLGPHIAPIGPARVPVRVFDSREFGDATEFLRKQNPLVAAGLAFAASLVVSLAVGSVAVWGLRRAGYKAE